MVKSFHINFSCRGHLLLARCGRCLVQAIEQFRRHFKVQNLEDDGRLNSNTSLRSTSSSSSSSWKAWSSTYCPAILLKELGIEKGGAKLNGRLGDFYCAPPAKTLSSCKSALIHQNSKAKLLFPIGNLLKSVKWSMDEIEAFCTKTTFSVTKSI